MRMRILEHRIVVLLGITLLMVLGCATFPGRLMEGEACRMLEKVVSILFEETRLAVPLRPLLPVLVKNQS